MKSFESAWSTYYGVWWTGVNAYILDHGLVFWLAATAIIYTSLTALLVFWNEQDLAENLSAAAPISMCLSFFTYIFLNIVALSIPLGIVILVAAGPGVAIGKILRVVFPLGISNEEQKK